jgi:hypothetical protein
MFTIFNLSSWTLDHLPLQVYLCLPEESAASFIDGGNSSRDCGNAGKCLPVSRRMIRR